MNNLTIHCFIKGKVQGVWFRASTKNMADKLQVTGWVRNLLDGTVEVMANGNQNKIEAFYTWLKKGPKLAKVTEIIYEVVEEQTFSSFTILK
jgi:acylphosphatase